MPCRWNLLPAMALAATAALGCGGGGDGPAAPAASSNNAQIRRGNPVPAASPSTAPAARPAEAASMTFDGQWTITLLPEAAEAGFEPPTVEASFDGDTGTVGDSEVEALAIDAAASPVPTIRFTTGPFQYVGVSGEERTADGPIEWTGGLYDGGETIVGVATVPGGRKSAWEATRR